MCVCEEVEEEKREYEREREREGVGGWREGMDWEGRERLWLKKKKKAEKLLEQEDFGQCSSHCHF